MQKIVVNGTEYESVEAMPPDVRRIYEQLSGMLADSDGDGVPDLAQGAVSQTVSTQFVVDGRAASRIEDLPPEARRQVEQALASLDRNRNGVPDVLEESGLLGLASAAQGGGASPAGQAGGSAIPGVTVVGESGGGRARALLLVVVALLLVIAGLAYLLLAR